MRMHFRRKGFSLAELIVTIMIFSLCVTTLVTILSMALRQISRTDRNANAQRIASASLECISNELRTAVINDSSTGYKSISSDLAATAIMTPSAVGSSSTELSFSTVNNYAYFPTSITFNEMDSAIYQKIRYYVSTNGKELHREVKQYNSTGAVTSTDDMIVTEVEDGSITMNVTLISTSSVNIQITSTVGTQGTTSVYSLTNRIFIPAS
ncbi:MAG: type II secretion system protein J [Vulcanimicrobiota bacterium]